MARSRDTMNRPDSGSLNSGAEPTVAAKAFEKAIKENSVTPAIATGFVPPVVASEEADRASRPSPFKQIKNAGGEDHDTDTAVKKNTAPAIANGFIPMPGYMKKQEINPFKSNKGPVKRPVSASVNHAAAAAAGEVEDTVEDESKSASAKPSLTAALVGQEVHTTFRPTEFKTQDKINPFKSNVESVTAEVETAEEVKKQNAPLKRRSPFQVTRPDPIVKPESAEEPAPSKAAEPEPEPVVDPVAFQAAPEPEAVEEPSHFKDAEPEPAVEPEIEPEPVAEPAPEPASSKEYSPFKQADNIDDFEPVEGFSPFKPLEGEVKADDEPKAPQPAKTEPTFYSSETEDKGRGGILGGLFKRR